jgi:hypothetical protein
VEDGEWTVVDGLPVTTVLRTVADLAEVRIDGGHLARVVRDALTIKLVDDQDLIAVLRAHAHRYGAPMGDGKSLLVRFLQESGVSVPLGRAVELARVSDFSDRAVTALTKSPELKRLQEQLASIQLAISPAEESLASLPGMGTIQEIARTAGAVNSPSMHATREFAKHGELAEISRVAEQIRQVISTPEFQQALAEQARRKR